MNDFDINIKFRAAHLIFIISSPWIVQNVGDESYPHNMIEVVESIGSLGLRLYLHIQQTTQNALKLLIIFKNVRYE